MSQTVIMNINTHGKKIDLKIGDEIQIELESVGGTGYHWYFDGLDNDLFELVGKSTRAITGDREKSAGAPVTGIWKLKPRKTGNGLIRMKYYRIWEGGGKAINHFEVEVEIKP